MADYVLRDKDVNIAGVQPDTLAAFTRMAAEYRAKTGKPIQVNSGYRSLELQQKLHAADPSHAAKPGKSMHNYGHALDIQTEDADRLASLGLLDKYGFHRPLMKPGIKFPETWHIELKGLDYNKIRAVGYQVAAGGTAVLLLVALGVAVLAYVRTTVVR